MQNTYNLDFDSTCSDDHRERLPNYAGIYVVYKSERLNNGMVMAEKIVYIGEAENINTILYKEQHEHYNNFISSCGSRENLFYKCSKIMGDGEDRKRVESALIFKLKPIINTDCKDYFPYDRTIINSTGRHHPLIPKSLVVETGK